MLYRDTIYTKQLKVKIQEINQCNSKHRVVLPYNNRELTIICDLHTVFNNGSFKDNGRFYCGSLGYQSLPQEDRARLLIDGNPTVELDYSGLHPRLLYAMKGIQFSDDPYTKVTDDKNLRPILKKVLLALFNTEDYATVVRAGNYAVFREEPEFKKTMRNSDYTIKQLVEKFKKAHEPIVEYFCTEQGYNLMHVDSKIARQVLEHFTGKNEAILSIHDSFIVIDRLEEEFREVMELSYKNITKAISPDHGLYTCKISKK